MRLAGFIPKYISNRLVLGFFELLRFFQRAFHIAWKRSDRQLSANAETEVSGMIENQHSYDHMSYGVSDIGYAGCEVVATFNALVNMGKKVKLSDLIHAFEHDGMVLSGRFGSSPKAIRDYFNRHGYVTRLTTKESEFDEVGDESDNLILTMYNDRTNIMKEVHTICITRGEDGLYAHNVYREGWVVGPEPTVTGLLASINGGLAKGISLISISEKSKE